MGINTKEYKREYYKRNAEKIRRQMKEWRLRTGKIKGFRTPKKDKLTDNPKYHKNWRDKNKPHLLKYWKGQRKNPLLKPKIKARDEAKRKIPIPKNKMCEVCGVNKAKERHHDDYKKPLEIKFLCLDCHKSIHSKKGKNLFKK